MTTSKQNTSKAGQTPKLSNVDDFASFVDRQIREGSRHQISVAVRNLLRKASEDAERRG